MCGWYKDEKAEWRIVLISSSEELRGQTPSTVANLMSKRTLKMTHLETMKITEKITEQYERVTDDLKPKV